MNPAGKDTDKNFLKMIPVPPATAPVHINRFKVLLVEVDLVTTANNSQVVSEYPTQSTTMRYMAKEMEIVLMRKISFLL